MRFCQALVEKLVAVNSLPGNKISGVRNSLPISPTIWPAIDTKLIDLTDCRSLLQIYDDSFRNLIHLEYNFPQGQGPLLVAFNGRYQRGMAQKPKTHGIYLDASELLESEFPRLVDTWYTLMSRSPETWSRTMKTLDINERVTKTLRSFR